MQAQGERRSTVYNLLQALRQVQEKLPLSPFEGGFAKRLGGGIKDVHELLSTFSTLPFLTERDSLICSDALQTLSDLLLQATNLSTENAQNDENEESL